MHSVQMVMLTAPGLREAAAFYVDHLGFRATALSEREAVVEAYGMQVVLSIGPGGGHSSAPAPERAAIVEGISMAARSGRCSIPAARSST